MSIRTIKVNKRIAAGLEWVLGEGSVYIGDDFIEGRNGFDWTDDQIVAFERAILEIKNCLLHEKHFKVTISKK